MKLVGTENLIKFFEQPEAHYYLPYHYDHKDPEEYFRKFREQFKKNIPRNWICGDDDLVHYASDCLMFFFSSSSPDGIPGIIYTQTGLQSSLARQGHTNTDTLKYHQHYNAALEKINPDVCVGLEYFSVKMEEIVELRSIYARDKSLYEGHMEEIFVKKNLHYGEPVVEGKKKKRGKGGEE